MACNKPAAHVDEDSRWHSLHDHLTGTAERAAAMAREFGSAEWGYLAGLWHDLGKYQVEFQAKLGGEQIFVEHSGTGAALAFQKFKDSGIPLAFGIGGHHAGLANWVVSGSGLPTPLKERLSENQERLKRVLTDIPSSLTNQLPPEMPTFLQMHGVRDGNQRGVLKRRVEFWTRFLFSVLVDADRLDTEEFMTPSRTALRSQFASLSELKERIDCYIDHKVAGIPPGIHESSVNILRSEVLEASRDAGRQTPGAFSLTVPTGGGKTLSAMSFALRHAEHNNLQRVIVVIPYTSIIEQNAQEYRIALGVKNVVEHHANIDPVKARVKHGEEITHQHELACENWDAPVIVTTTVQFFETLLSSRPSQCRKLHNVARSVIILDEVQTLPSGFLLSILDALKELVEHYGCSIVLSTATPPALAAREGFECGLENIRPIVPGSKQFWHTMKRVEYTWPSTEDAPLDWPELAAKLAKYAQVLAVVHKRDDARILAQQLQELVPDEAIFHLSALMCPAHRLDVLAEIRKALAHGDNCRVVSTQLVEAGVDIDFPLVYRALGGLDSIVQAAGRCNREGQLDKGQVVVFRALTSPPRGTPKRGMEVMEALLRRNGSEMDPDDPKLLETYFRSLYFAENKDVHNIQSHREGFDFATVGREFKMIDDGFTRSVVVPYGEAVERLENLRHEGPNRERYRQLQPFMVNIYLDSFDKLMKSGALNKDKNNIFSLTLGFEHLYDDTFGLVVGDEPVADPGSFIL